MRVLSFLSNRNKKLINYIKIYIVLNIRINWKKEEATKNDKKRQKCINMNKKNAKNVLLFFRKRYKICSC